MESWNSGKMGKQLKIKSYFLIPNIPVLIQLSGALNLRSHNALETTVIDESAIAPAAKIGVEKNSKKWKMNSRGHRDEYCIISKSPEEVLLDIPDGSLTQGNGRHDPRKLPLIKNLDIRNWNLFGAWNLLFKLVCLYFIS